MPFSKSKIDCPRSPAEIDSHRYHSPHTANMHFKLDGLPIKGGGEKVSFIFRRESISPAFLEGQREGGRKSEGKIKVSSDNFLSIGLFDNFVIFLENLAHFMKTVVFKGNLFNYRDLSLPANYLNFFFDGLASFDSIN